jgi:rod shape-determining protein MreC
MEAICVYLMYRNNGYQGSSIFNSSNKVSANVYQTAANIREYLLLKDENKRLAYENAQLYNMLKTGYMAVPLSTFVKKDTLYKQQYTYMAAKTVNSSINKRSNYLTLNVGSEQGITRDMAVINSDGAVGFVKDVSRNFCSVMSLLHKDMRVNCQLKAERTYGPLVWEGDDYQYCLLKDIPVHTRIKKGDLVVTSEKSGIFPEGISVGTVDSYEQRSGEPFLTVKVKLVTDFKKLNYVFVIKNKFKIERDSLEKASQTQSDK